MFEQDLFHGFAAAGETFYASPRHCRLLLEGFYDVVGQQFGVGIGNGLGIESGHSAAPLANLSDDLLWTFYAFKSYLAIDQNHSLFCSSYFGFKAELFIFCLEIIFVNN